MPGRYKGRLPKQPGRPFQAVLAVLYNEENVKVDNTVTDENGTYEFQGISNGNYQVRFFGRNYGPDDYIDITVVDFDEIDKALEDFYIRPLDGTVIRKDTDELRFEIIFVGNKQQQIVTGGDVKFYVKGEQDEYILVQEGDPGVVGPFSGYSLKINAEFFQNNISLYAVEKVVNPEDPLDIEYLEYDNITIADLTDKDGFVGWITASSLSVEVEENPDTLQNEFVPPTVTITPNFAYLGEQIDLVTATSEGSFSFKALPPEAPEAPGVTVDATTGVVTIDSETYFSGNASYTINYEAEYLANGQKFVRAVSEEVIRTFQGSDSRRINLISDQVFKEFKDGTTTPTMMKITPSLENFSYPKTIDWITDPVIPIYDEAGVEITSKQTTVESDPFSPTDGSIWVKEEDVQSRVRVTGDLSDLPYLDQISLIRIIDGDDAINYLLSSEAHTYSFTPSGELKGNISEGNQTLRVFQGIAELTGSPGTGALAPGEFKAVVQSSGDMGVTVEDLPGEDAVEVVVGSLPAWFKEDIVKLAVKATGFRGQENSEIVKNISYNSSYDGPSTGFLDIVFNHDPNENGWFNLSHVNDDLDPLTWRLNVGSKAFTYEYRLVKDQHGTNDQGEPIDESDVVIPWSEWVPNVTEPQLFNEQGRWTFHVRAIHEDDPELNVETEHRAFLETELPTWEPQRNFEFVEGFGAVKFTWTSVPDPTNGIPGIQSFSGDNNIRIKFGGLAPAGDGSGEEASRVYGVVPEDQEYFQYNDFKFDSQLYYFINVKSKAGNERKKIEANGPFQAFKLTPSNLDDELTIIYNGPWPENDTNPTHYQTLYNLNNRVDSLQVTTNKNLWIRDLELQKLSNTETDSNGDPVREWVRAEEVKIEGGPIDPTSETPGMLDFDFATGHELEAGRPYVIKFTKDEIFGIRARLEDRSKAIPADVTNDDTDTYGVFSVGDIGFWNPVEKVAAELFIGDRFEVQRGIVFMNEESDRRILFDFMGLRGWKDVYIPEDGGQTFNLGLDGSFFAGYKGYPGKPDSYIEFDPEVNAGEGLFTVRGRGEIDEGRIGQWEINDTSIFNLPQSGGIHLKAYSGASPDSPHFDMTSDENESNWTFRIRSDQMTIPMVLPETQDSLTFGFDSDFGVEMTGENLSNPRPINDPDKVLEIRYRLEPGTAPSTGSISVAATTVPDSVNIADYDIIETRDWFSIDPGGENYITNLTLRNYTHVALIVDVKDGNATVTGNTESHPYSDTDPSINQYIPRTVINRDGIFTRVTPTRVVALSSSSSDLDIDTTVDWKKVQNKPFSEIGDNLESVGGSLRVVNSPEFEGNVTAYSSGGGQSLQHQNYIVDSLSFDQLTKTGINAGDLFDASGIIKEAFLPSDLAGGGGDVTSVNGQVGDVVLSISDLGGTIQDGQVTSSAVLQHTNGVYLEENETISLSGDITGSGKTAITATLKTVNTDTGSFGDTIQIPSIAVNGKGLITGASQNTIRTAGATQSGIVSIGTQTFGGEKTFNEIIKSQKNIIAYASGGGTSIQDSSYSVSSLSFDQLTKTGTNPGDLFDLNGIIKSSFLPQFSTGGDVTSVNGKTGEVVLSFSDLSGTIDSNQVLSGAVTQHTGSIDHNSLTNYAANEHRAWENDILQSVHINNIPTIPNSKLSNSSLTVTAGTGLNGGGSVSLGGTTTLNIVNPFNPNNTYLGLHVGSAGEATKLSNARTIAISGDIVYTSAPFDGTTNVTGVATLAQVNTTTGSFGDTINIPQIQVNGKGLVTNVTASSVQSASTTQKGVVTVGDQSFEGIKTFIKELKSNSNITAYAGGGGTSLAEASYTVSALSFDQLTKTGTNPGDLFDLNGIIKSSFLPDSSGGGSVTSVNGQTGEVVLGFSNLSGTIENNQVLSGAITQHVGSIDHNALSNYAANEHRVWENNIAQNIHVGNITATAVTQHVGSIDHNSLSNYAANEHRVWENSIAQTVHINNIPTIPNSKLSNSTIGITAGTGLNGGGTASLGGSVSISVVNPFDPSGNYPNLRAQATTIGDVGGVPSTGGTFTGNVAFGSRIEYRSVLTEGIEKKHFRYGGGTDTNWYKVATLKQTASSSYKAVNGEIEILYYGGNYGQNIPEKYKSIFSLSAYGGSSSLIDNVELNNTVGVENYARIVKNGVNDYELQVRSPVSWRTFNAIVTFYHDTTDNSSIEDDLVTSSASTDVVSAGGFYEEFFGDIYGRQASFEGNVTAYSSGGSSIQDNSYSVSSLSFDQLTKTGTNPGDLFDLNGVIKTSFLPDTSGGGAVDSVNGKTGSVIIGFSDLSGTIENNQVLSGAVTQHVGSINHNSLLNYSANEHRVWENNIAQNIHSGNITSGAVTQHTGSIDHNSLSNYAANEHRVWESSIIQNIHINNIPTIPNSKLSNSSVTVGAGTGLSGGGAVSLGGSISLSINNPFNPSGTYSQLTAGHATTSSSWASGITLSITGDLTYTSPSFDGSSNVSAAATLKTVNTNTGSFGNSIQVPQITVNGKGLITGVQLVTIRNASTTLSGVVSTGSQSFSGIKTFTDELRSNSNIVAYAAGGGSSIQESSYSVSSLSFDQLTKTGTNPGDLFDLNGIIKSSFLPTASGGGGDVTSVNSKTGEVVIGFSDLSGTIENNQVLSGTITQHTGSINHDSLLNYSASEHRVWESSITQNVHINNIPAIPNSKLSNSSVGVTAGTGLSGGGSVSLGGTITLSVSNPFNPSGTYTNLVAQGTTASDVGLGNVPNWSGSTSTSLGISNSVIASQGSIKAYVDNQVSNKGNWDTAYLQRGGVIAGTWLSWDGSDLNVQVGTVKANITGNSNWSSTNFNNSNWDLAHAQTRQWDGGSTGLTASTGRSSLGLSDAATTTVSNIRAGTTAGNVGLGNVPNWSGSDDQALGLSSNTIVSQRAIKTYVDNGLGSKANSSHAHGYADLPITSVQASNWDSAHSHISSTGTSHTYIDQDIRTTADVSFASVSSAGVGSFSHMESSNHFWGKSVPLLSGTSTHSDQVVLLVPFGGGTNEIIGTMYGHRSSGLFGGRKLEIMYSSAQSNTNYNAVFESSVGASEEWDLVSCTYNSTQYLALRLSSTTEHLHTDNYFTGFAKGAVFQAVAISAGVSNITSISNGKKYFQSNVGVKNKNPLYDLHVEGDVYASGDSIASEHRSPSDRRLKKLIKKGSGRDIAKNAQLWLYEKEGMNRSQWGLIAQDMLKSDKNLVSKTQDGMYALSSYSIASAALHGVKEIDQEIEILKKRIEELEKQRGE